MRSTLLALLLIFVGEKGLAYDYKPEDFYFQEESGKHVGLKVTNKVVAVFSGAVGTEEKALLLAKLGTFPESIKKAQEELEEIKTKKLPDINSRISKLLDNTTGEYTQVLQERYNLHLRVAVLEKEIAKGADIIAIETFPKDYFQRLILTLGIYPPYSKNPIGKILLFINEHNKDPKMTLFPVFIVDGREATFSNVIKIKTVDAIDQSRLGDILNKMNIGNFYVGSSALPTEGVYYITIDKLNLPINLLTFANMLSDKPWLEYAQPNFQFLSPPIMAKFHVAPNGAPTLGEKRTLVVEIIIDDPKLELKEDEIPQLGQGSFNVVPLGASTISANAGASNVFFKFEEGSKIVEMVDGKKIWTLSWPFYSYATGTYVFTPLNIPVEGLEGGVFTVSPLNFGFSVSSITKLSILEVTDIQSIKNHQIGFTEVQNIPPVAEPESAGPWFVTQIAVATALVVLGSLVWIWPVAGVISSVLSKRAEKERENFDLFSKLKSLERAISYKNYKDIESALRQCLFLFGIPENISANELGKKITNTIEDCDRRTIFETLQELDKRHDPKYRPSVNSLEILDECYDLCVIYAEEKGDKNV